MAKADFTTVTIHSQEGLASAEFVPQRGGFLCSLRLVGADGVKERLFLHDYAWQTNITDLPGGWPILFPVCARTEYQGEMGCYVYDKKKFHLPIHGFAWNMPWQYKQLASNCIELSLNENESTLEQYPFCFFLQLRYTLFNNRLVCHVSITNNDLKKMPYNLGFHPYFLLSLVTKDQVTLNYKPVKRYIYNEHLTQVIGETSLFDLPTAITNPQINEQLTRVGDDKCVVLDFPDGERLSIQTHSETDEDLFPYVQLYTIADKPFFCVEPWMGFPNAINASEGMRWLKPGQTESGELVLTIEASPEA